MIVRYCKIVLVFVLALFGALGIFNLLSWDNTLQMVGTIVSMSGVPGGEDFVWATDSSLVTVLGALFIAFGKLSGGLFCGIAAIQMWTHRQAGAEQFNAAKTYALLGCSIFLFLFFGGFMYLAGQFFMGWRTDLGEAATTGAFQLGGSVALILLFVNQPDT